MTECKGKRLRDASTIKELHERLEEAIAITGDDAVWNVGLVEHIKRVGKVFYERRGASLDLLLTVAGEEFHSCFGPPQYSSVRQRVSEVCFYHGNKLKDVFMVLKSQIKVTPMKYS